MAMECTVNNHFPMADLRKNPYHLILYLPSTIFPETFQPFRHTADRYSYWSIVYLHTKKE